MIKKYSSFDIASRTIVDESEYWCKYRDVETELKIRDKCNEISESVNKSYKKMIEELEEKLSTERILYSQLDEYKDNLLEKLKVAREGFVDILNITNNRVPSGVGANCMMIAAEALEKIKD
jgi:transcription antitermination factor NusA-like protein